MAPPDYTDPNTIGKAHSRAAKLMAMLFKPQNFSAIMKAVDPVRDRNAFNAACNAANLTTEETAWLWNYLDQCNSNIYGDPNVRDLASSGW